MIIIYMNVKSAMWILKVWKWWGTILGSIIVIKNLII